MPKQAHRAYFSRLEGVWPAQMCNNSQFQFSSIWSARPITEGLFYIWISQSITTLTTIAINYNYINYYCY